MRRPRGERGATLVEFGVVALLLFTLLFGVVELGVAYDKYLAVRTASREGARLGVVGTLGSTADCGIDGAAAGAGEPTRRLICLTKERAGLGDDVRVAVAVPTYAEGEPLTVCVQHRLGSVTGLFGPVLDGRVVQSDVQMRIEDTSDGASLESTSEQSPGGGPVPCAAG